MDNDGRITGIIDWDGMHIAPRILGYEAYLHWLVSNWDAGSLLSRSIKYQFPREELSLYGEAYLNFLADHKDQMSIPQAPEITKASLLAKFLDCSLNLDYHIDNEPSVIFNILHEITFLAGRDPRAPNKARDIGPIPSSIDFAKAEKYYREHPVVNLTVELAMRIYEGSATENEIAWLADGFRFLIA